MCFLCTPISSNFMQIKFNLVMLGKRLLFRNIVNAWNVFSWMVFLVCSMDGNIQSIGFCLENTKCFDGDLVIKSNALFGAFQLNAKFMSVVCVFVFVFRVTNWICKFESLNRINCSKGDDRASVACKSFEQKLTFLDQILQFNEIILEIYSHLNGGLTDWVGLARFCGAIFCLRKNFQVMECGPISSILTVVIS